MPVSPLASHAARSRGPRPLLLTIDDDEGVRDAYGLLFDDWLEVVGVGSAARALAVARERHFNAILLDIRMPRMSGLEVL